SSVSRSATPSRDGPLPPRPSSPWQPGAVLGVDVLAGRGGAVALVVLAGGAAAAGALGRGRLAVDAEGDHPALGVGRGRREPPAPAGVHGAIDHSETRGR